LFDQWLNDRFVMNIKRYILRTFSNDVILAYFQQMNDAILKSYEYF